MGDPPPVRMFAFIRAINTGRRRLTNEQLLGPFRSAGLLDVSAYQAAGNVAFRTSRPASDVEAELEVALGEAYGFEARAFVRTAAELEERVAALPFTAEELAGTEGRTQVTFLAAVPTAAQVEEALALVPAEDVVHFVGREWWWLPRAGISGSALPVSRIERIVGPMTMRTVGTVERMLARFAG